MKRKILFVAIFSLVSVLGYSQSPNKDRVPVPDFEVPYESDIHDLYQSQYNYGYRLGKMYADDNNGAAYKYMLGNITDIRNNSGNDFMASESQLLGLVAGWNDNRTIKDTGVVLNVKNIMHAPFGSGDAYRAYTGTNSFPGGRGSFYMWIVKWDFTTFGIEVAKLHIL